MLTPIKIPGKNKTDMSKAAVAARRASKQKVRRGRPSKSATPSSSRASSSSITSRSTTPLNLPVQKLANVRARKQQHRPQTSLLERLPTEILQRIFTFCFNFELPRTSRIIRDKLSSPHIYLESIIHAFEPSWIQRLAGLRSGLSAKGAALHTRTTITCGDPVLQSQLLRCRWATLDILETAEKRWLGKTQSPLPEIVKSATKKTINLDFADASNETGDVLQHFNFDAFLEQDENDNESQDEGDGRFSGKLLDDEFDNDYKLLTTVATAEKEHVRRSRVLKTPKSIPSLHGMLQMHPDTQIPETLLKGPWSANMEKHLLYLVRAYPRINWIETTDGEVLSQGLTTAIETGNIAVLLILEKLDLGQLIHENMVVAALRKANGNTAFIIYKLLRMLENGSQLGNFEQSKIYRRVAFEAYRQREESSEKRYTWEQLDVWIGLKHLLRPTTINRIVR